MNEDVLLQLSIAKQYEHHANFAGTPRQAIADGYSAVDTMFTALLMHDGRPQPRNHKLKFEQAREYFPNAFAAESVQMEKSWHYSPGADWESLAGYYKEWLESRYSKFEMDPGEASARVRETHAVVASGIRFLAKKELMEAGELDALAADRAFGFKFSEVSAAVGEAHDLLFQDAEMAGDEHGSKLGVKLAAATNFCDLDITAGDGLTQRILLEDKEVAGEAAVVYHRFVQLVEKIQAKRLDRIAGGKAHDTCAPEEIIDATDFMLSMKARYHGGTIPLVGVPWSKTLKGVLSLVSEHLKRSAASGQP